MGYNDTLKDFQAKKNNKLGTRSDKKYIKSIEKELKRYGFAYVVDTRGSLDEIRERFPNAEIRRLETMYEVVLEE